VVDIFACPAKGVDISEPMVAFARLKDPDNRIDFQIRNLSEPVPELENQFDLIASNMVLNDVPDYRGFIDTICLTLKPGGRAIFSLNNPYSAVGRSKADNYFDSGNTILYGGMAEAGVKVYYYHRTLEEFITAFSDNGLLLRSLRDIQPTHFSSVKSVNPLANLSEYCILIRPNLFHTFGLISYVQKNRHWYYWYGLDGTSPQPVLFASSLAIPRKRAQTPSGHLL